MWMMKTMMSLLVLTVSVSECGSRTVIGRRGQNITLPCTYDIKANGEESICWGRGTIPSSGCNNQIIGTGFYKVKEENSSKYQLLGQLDQGDVSLTILNLAESDAGQYGCRVEISGWFNDEKYHFDLTIEPGVVKTATAITSPRGNYVTTTEFKMTPTESTTLAPPAQTFTLPNTVRVSVTFILTLSPLAVYDQGAACQGLYFFFQLKFR
ncbi:hepatitis A virus cellular receptor 1 homolog isoform 2-T2 [Pholidichthys leucotaenia]